MQRTIALSNGVEMPRVGLGTFKAQGADVQTAVRAALAAGIRHFDTASIYKNQTDIAEALKASGVRRDDVFLTSKVSPFEQGAAKAAQAVDDILSSLGTSYVDLLLVHWPGASRVPPGSPLNAELRGQTWRVLERAYRDGRARAIGVSNYEERHLAELLATAEVRPMVNQIEVHPRRQCAALRAACAEAGE